MIPDRAGTRFHSESRFMVNIAKLPEAHVRFQHLFMAPPLFSSEPD